MLYIVLFDRYAGAAHNGFSEVAATFSDRSDAEKWIRQVSEVRERSRFNIQSVPDTNEPKPLFRYKVRNNYLGSHFFCEIIGLYLDWPKKHKPKVLKPHNDYWGDYQVIDAFDCGQAVALCQL